jgi:hypothetical protein
LTKGARGIVEKRGLGGLLIKEAMEIRMVLPYV